MFTPSKHCEGAILGKSLRHAARRAFATGRPWTNGEAVSVCRRRYWSRIVEDDQLLSPINAKANELFGFTTGRRIFFRRQKIF